MLGKGFTAGRTARRIVVCLLAVALVAPTMTASLPSLTDWTEAEKFSPGDADSTDEFGASTIVDGDLAVVGAPSEDNDNGEDAGAVYVFSRALLGGWTQEAKLLASDGTGDDRFGSAVDLDGDTLLVGAEAAEDPNGAATGAAYVFTRVAPGEWVEETKLLASDGSDGADLGEAVSLDGDRALLGAHLADNTNEDNAGSAYTFVRGVDGTWSQEAEIAPSDGDPWDDFGQAVTLDGDQALMAAPGDDDPGQTHAGSVYIFQDSDGGWSLDTKIENPGVDRSDSFGQQLSLEGDVALIGVPLDDVDGFGDVGTVYVYARTDGDWNREDTLRADDAGSLSRFGSSLSLDGERALIGSGGDTNANGYYAGAAYIYSRVSLGNWTEETKLNASDGDYGDSFGDAVSLDGATALVGAPTSWVVSDTPGSAYVFTNILEQVEAQVQDATDPDATPAMAPLDS